ncbi:MAG TPA: hypothetical protein V6C86_05535 [Oculatellaceae cyanobacterium]
MSEQPKSDDAKESLKSEQENSEQANSGVTNEGAPEGALAGPKELPPNLALSARHESPATNLSSQAHETEWIPGEHLELIRIPPPTVWPVTLALGVTGIAFGVVTHWILSLAGLFLFLLGAAGWIEDLRKDVLQ